MDFKLKSHISAAILSLFIWISMGTIVYQRIENWDWIQAFYFSVTTLTTVGLGDLAPTTNLARLIARTEKGVHIGTKKSVIEPKQ